MEHDSIVGADRKAIALVMGRSRTVKEDAANLAFICRAVNNHYSLLEACKTLLEITAYSKTSHQYLNAVDVIRKSTGGTP